MLLTEQYRFGPKQRRIWKRHYWLIFSEETIVRVTCLL